MIITGQGFGENCHDQAPGKYPDIPRQAVADGACICSAAWTLSLRKRRITVSPGSWIKKHLHSCFCHDLSKLSTANAQGWRLTRRWWTDHAKESRKYTESKLRQLPHIDRNTLQLSRLVQIAVRFFQYWIDDRTLCSIDIAHSPSGLWASRPSMSKARYCTFRTNFSGGSRSSVLWWGFSLQNVMHVISWLQVVSEARALSTLSSGWGEGE